MTNQVTFTEHEIMQWQPVEPPHWWPAAGACVVADRHLPDGTRQHQVRAQVPEGLVIANAQVFSAFALPEVQTEKPA